jgi:hypothetical protein
MSWDSVEAKVETCLKTAMEAATDSASITVRYHCYWADSEAQTLTLPAVTLTASPAVNDGYRTTLFKVPVDVAVLTSPVDDAYRSSAKAIYGKIRQAVEEATLSVSGWPNLAVTVEQGGGMPETIPDGADFPGGLHVIPLALVAEAALPVT